MLENYIAKNDLSSLEESKTEELAVDDRTKEEIVKEDDSSLYDISNFSV